VADQPVADPLRWPEAASRGRPPAAPGGACGLRGACGGHASSCVRNGAVPTGANQALPGGCVPSRGPAGSPGYLCSF